jgi:hypothetical protein
MSKSRGKLEDFIVGALLRTDDIEFRQKARDISVAAIRRVTRHLTMLEPGDVPEQLCGPLRRDGLQRLGQLPSTLCRDILAKLNETPMYNSYSVAESDGVARPLAEARGYSIGLYAPDTVVNTPGVMDVANDATVLKTVEAYLGCVPRIYSISVWRSFPGTGRNITQTFHRDYDDFKFCSLFVYLTDVELPSGPHQYIVGSHSIEGVRAMIARIESSDSGVTGTEAHEPPRDPSFYFRYRLTEIGGEKDEFDRAFARVLAPHVTNVLGKAGTIFLSDTHGLHRGLHPETDERVIMNVRYGIGAGSFGPLANSSKLDPANPFRRYLRSPIYTHVNGQFL